MPDVQKLEPGLVRIVAPNPSPMTERGTNTYLLGDPQAVAVIDPGPAHDDHLAAILSAIGDRDVTQILVTHAHLDHSPIAARLSRHTGAPILAYGDARAGRPERMEGLTDLGGGEGVDANFVPDRQLADGEVIETPAGPVEAMWTPGHFGNHLAFLWTGAAFSGDLVMGWASTFISPPDGDVGAFLDSCRRLNERAPRRLYPGHGAPVEDPPARIDWLIAHRKAREAQVLDALCEAPGTPASLAARIYADIPPAMLPAATRNVLAHLIDLTARGHVRHHGAAGSDTTFHL
ncbi:Glyoxylase, beta-lactamase superfamily II [Palleronia marisminoris]|uniref:Metallo-beta-lactamase L1 n=1 Tax=Palleronia marisminoris TaxID=315423 RepID=A0A1Y5R9H2_9RHOB|nr:MBL fold metallo-hydrolase [Palleronia marisminoris]SFG09629.1 Glyoxylase, beta-lactamase superfamily II [Palleronia marisminoris]SLN12246.1 Metallo-beta-lactamase L1 precursor [Palleronia marisminoris]